MNSKFDMTHVAQIQNLTVSEGGSFNFKGQEALKYGGEWATHKFDNLQVGAHFESDGRVLQRASKLVFPEAELERWRLFLH